MIDHCLVRVADGNIAQFGIAAVSRGPCQEFQVHHVVDDHRAGERLVIP
jgi:hypothetical protein